ncbi:MAG: hypothetical protein HY329_12895 [Chloroflexi bacterium]|nr:hypothetical protein [Chloroflexota bacterium]
MNDLIEQTVAQFLATELPTDWPDVSSTPTIAAIGTVAEKALDSPLLRDRLDAARVEPAEYRPFSGLEGLLADESWALALVLSPFKREVPESCSSLTPAAAATGVVDTLLRVPSGVQGVNTNVAAAAGALVTLTGGNVSRALVAGTGASARSVAVALRRVAPGAQLGVVGRSAERAAEVVRDLGAAVVVTDPADFAADAVVNTTTVGETDDTAALDFDLTGALRPGVRFFDLNNRTSALQVTALRAGCVTSSGVPMQILTNALRVALLVPR